MASLEPSDFQSLVDQVDVVSQALGTVKSAALPIEEDVATVAKKSLVASCSISEGELFSEQNLSVKRPGTGVPASLYYDFIGKVAQRDYEIDDFI